nr:unnamed protein product [Callosobruchus analis]
MYRLYLEYCEEKAIPKQSVAQEWLYHEIFNYEFNCAFKLPANDTCDLCGKLQLQLQEVDSQNSRTKLPQQHDQHLDDASNRYKMKAEDKIRSRSNTTEKLIMIGFEKCLPISELTNSQIFYSLKPWTYNLVIYHSTSHIPHCMMWDQTIAGRGGHEIASCLVKWAEVSGISDSVQELSIWLDDCPSQNRNMLIVMSSCVISGF